jgi:hypothetical protein
MAEWNLITKVYKSEILKRSVSEEGEPLNHHLSAMVCFFQSFLVCPPMLIISRLANTPKNLKIQKEV